MAKKSSPFAKFEKSSKDKTDSGMKEMSKGEKMMGKKQMGKMMSKKGKK